MSPSKTPPPGAQRADDQSLQRPEHLPIQERVALAPMTTLGIGGEARFLARPSSVQELRQCLEWGRAHQLPRWILGGGSNVVIADEGLDGLVVQIQAQGREILSEDDDGRVVVKIDAGHDWDELVAWSVAEGLAGIECLSGIPGFVGAAPIQNIGAYGQELRDVFVEATVMRLSDGAISSWDTSQCRFAYRDSAFKQAPGEFLVLDVTLALQRGGAPTLNYNELIQAVAYPTQDDGKPDLAASQRWLQRVREVVLGLRRTKSMVFDPHDPNSHSAGSFFTNPIIDEAQADEAWAQLQPRLSEGVVMPRYPVAPGKVKLSAAWLIERCGLPKGCHIGAVGLSQKHTLALVNRGGATAQRLLQFARMIQEHVAATCGVTLHPEPVTLGAIDFAAMAPSPLEQLVRPEPR